MGSLVCRIELDKKDGVILTVENGDAGITQTFVMDGTSITTTVEGREETSTITQDQGSIAINCKTFTLDAETITCRSTQGTKHESGRNFSIKSGENIDVSAAVDAIYNAVNTSVQSSAQTDVKAGTGNSLTLSAAGAELKGAMITLDAKGLMDLIAKGIVTVDGNVVNIAGKAIKVG